MEGAMIPMIDRDKLVEDLGNVHDFLRAIEDPAADSVAVAAGIISGELEWHPAARLLTLGEVREWKDFLWVEIRESGAVPKGVFKGIFVKMEETDMVFHLRRPYWIGRHSAVLYGFRFRCWAEEPTADDMAGAEWEAGDPFAESAGTEDPLEAKVQAGLAWMRRAARAGGGVDG